jgi:hypothetical protein
LKYETAPIAVLTGTSEFEFNDNDVTALRRFVTRGGTLLIDSCGGSKSFADFVETKLLPKPSSTRNRAAAAGSSAAHHQRRGHVRPSPTKSAPASRRPLRACMPGRGRLFIPGWTSPAGCWGRIRGDRGIPAGVLSGPGEECGAADDQAGRFKP